MENQSIRQCLVLMGKKGKGEIENQKKEKELPMPCANKHP
jgi:hypothetical protein